MFRKSYFRIVLQKIHRLLIEYRGEICYDMLCMVVGHVYFCLYRGIDRIPVKKEILRKGNSQKRKLEKRSYENCR